ncbi:MAG: HdeD family acid-resistance protein [Chloroflexi bacterium]|nr:HdeD family acid-resistance protein [Chloroflexota bacterium]
MQITRVTSSWWAIALRGVIAIIFGLLALIWPGLALLTLVLMFGAYVLVDGILSAIAGISAIGTDRRWWAMMLVGAAGIIAGILTLFNPRITGIVLLTFIAAWAIVTGIFEIVAAIQLRRVITNEWAMGLSGALLIVFGVLLLMFPGAGALSLTWLIATGAVLFGILMLILGFRLRGLQREMGEAGRLYHP